MLQSTLLVSCLSVVFAALTESAALPTFSLVGSSGLIEIPSSSTPCSSDGALPSTTDNLGLAFPTTAILPTLVPVNPILPTNPSELPLPSSVDLTYLNPSTLPTAVPITASYSVIQPSEILSLPPAVPITASYSVIDPSTLLPAPSETSISIAFPVYPPYSESSALYPTRSPRPRPHKTGGPRHGYGAGWWPTGVPRPTGGFGFATARPSGGYPGAGMRPSASTRALPAKETPCTLKTKVKPTATGAYKN